MRGNGDAVRREMKKVVSGGPSGAHADPEAVAGGGKTAIGVLGWRPRRALSPASPAARFAGDI